MATPLNDSFATTILNGQTQSGVVDLKRFTLCGIFIPATFTGTTVTFQAAPAVDGTYVNVQDGLGVIFSKTVSPGIYIPLNPSFFAGIRFLKISSGSAEGADRIITVAGRVI